MKVETMEERLKRTEMIWIWVLPHRSQKEKSDDIGNYIQEMDYSPPGSSIHGISQARILE